MTMDPSVRYFSSEDAGAPELTGEAGSLIALLDACLTTGYGSVTLTALTQTGGTATATVDASHGFHDYAVVEIAGATPAEYNGEHRIRVTSSTQFTFEVPSGLAGSATGTITAKLPAPGGWEKAFSGTNAGAYRSIDAQAGGHYLRVDDDGHHNSQEARVRAYQSMSDIDTGLLPYPSVADAASGLAWRKTYATGSTPYPWFLLADVRSIWFVPDARSGYVGQGFPYYFGDIESHIAADPDGVALLGNTTLNNGGFSYTPLYTVDPITLSPVAEKSMLYDGAAVRCCALSMARILNNGGPGSQGVQGWPAPGSLETYVARLGLAHDIDGNRVIRGYLRGAADPLHREGVSPGIIAALDTGAGVGPARCHDAVNNGQLIYAIEKW